MCCAVCCCDEGEKLIGVYDGAGEHVQLGVGRLRFQAGRSAARRARPHPVDSMMLSGPRCTPSHVTIRLASGRG